MLIIPILAFLSIQIIYSIIIGDSIKDKYPYTPVLDNKNANTTPTAIDSITEVKNTSRRIFI